MILLVDNYDSFVFNLYQLLGSLGEEIKVVRNDEIDFGEIEHGRYSHIVLSPGPGKPSEAGLCGEIVKKYGNCIPILGVCLGHQVIAEVYGGVVDHAKEVVHGQRYSMKVLNKGSIFKGLADIVDGARYHSLAISKATLPNSLEILAETEDGEIMAIQHKEYPVFGLQFHPESILTPDGESMVKNFLNL